MLKTLYLKHLFHSERDKSRGDFRGGFLLKDGDGSFLFSAHTRHSSADGVVVSVSRGKSWGQFQMPATRGRIKWGKFEISDWYSH